MCQFHHQKYVEEKNNLKPSKILNKLIKKLYIIQ
jgi:hypothetical protein